MACDPWTELQFTVAELHFDITVAEIRRLSNRTRSVLGFCSENEKSEQIWDNMMKSVNEHHYDIMMDAMFRIPIPA